MKTAPVVTLRELRARLRRRGRTVLTFAGQSDEGYRHPPRVLAQAQAVLACFDPDRTVVNAGATAAGIGAVYPLAKALGFATMGVVSTQAREQGRALSPAVDDAFFVVDARWGGYVPGSRRLTPVSAAMVGISDVFVALGGGPIARAEYLRARRRGVLTLFIAAAPAGAGQ